MHTDITHNIQKVLDQIHCAAQRAGRESKSITLVAVSKLQPLPKMRALQEFFGVRGEMVTFGENYVQEFKAKADQLSQPYQVHLIGPLQSNKAKDAVRLFDLIESVHSEKIAALLNGEASKIGKVQNVLLQVNISRDPAKSGFLPDDLARIVCTVLPPLASLKLCGLMAIPRLYDDRALVRNDYRALNELAKSFELPLELSMGMSDDFEIAIEEGATMVRIGTAIFGERE